MATSLALPGGSERQQEAPWRRRWDTPASRLIFLR